jgi:hypothetical protein
MRLLRSIVGASLVLSLALVLGCGETPGTYNGPAPVDKTIKAKKTGATKLGAHPPAPE